MGLVYMWYSHSILIDCDEGLSCWGIDVYRFWSLYSCWDISSILGYWGYICFDDV